MEEESTVLLTADEVGEWATGLLEEIEAHSDYEGLRWEVSARASQCITFGEFPTISKWNFDEDAPLLLDEALRVLALRIAVGEMTGDKGAVARVVAAAPVEAMVRIVLAESTVLTGMWPDLNVALVNVADLLPESIYEPGGVTDAYYAAAWEEEPNRRYWLGATEVARRREELNTVYEQAGFGRDGSSHTLSFREPTAAPRWLRPVGDPGA